MFPGQGEGTAKPDLPTCSREWKAPTGLNPMSNNMLCAGHTLNTVKELVFLAEAARMAQERWGDDHFKVTSCYSISLMQGGLQQGLSS